jgi:hypothetical protein
VLEGVCKCPAVSGHNMHSIVWASQGGLYAQVFLCARSQQDIDAALDSFKQQGYAVAGMAADVAQKEQREQLVQQVRCCSHKALGVCRQPAQHASRLQFTSESHNASCAACTRGCVGGITDIIAFRATGGLSPAAVPQVSDAFGGSLNILVNNVGTNIRKPTAEFTDQVGLRVAGLWCGWLAGGIAGWWRMMQRPCWAMHMHTAGHGKCCATITTVCRCPQPCNTLCFHCCRGFRCCLVCANPAYALCSILLHTS